MELKELYDTTLKIFDVENAESLGNSLIAACNDHEKLEGFINMVGGDLSRDWLQMIYQYYLADRKGKKQDYTPKNLAEFMGLLAGNSEYITDLCAGSGALTIQRWNQSKEQKFILYEIDEKVIPYLLFNLTVRNIDAVVYNGDALTGEIKQSYKVIKGDTYGHIVNIEPAV